MKSGPVTAFGVGATLSILAIAAAVLARPPGCLEAGAVRVPAGAGEPAGGGAHVAAAQLRDERVARARHRVVVTVHLELAPHAGHPAGSQVAHLVGIAAALSPGPQGGAGAEVVLELLMLDEVAVVRSRGAGGVGTPFSGQHRYPAERARLALCGLEGRAC